MRRASMFLALCLLLGVFGASNAADDVQIKAWFPDNANLEFVAGEEATAVVAVRNTGIAPFNITAAVANLALVSSPEGNIFNFTGLGYRVPQLNAKDEITIEYGFILPANLPPRDFFLHLNVYINQDEKHTPHLVFNETISVVETYKLVDTELLGLYAILLAAAAAAAYFLHKFALGKGWLKKGRKAKATTGVTAAAGDKSEWLKGTQAEKDMKKSASNKQL